MTEITRMQFLRGDLKGDKTPFRPPWAIPENYFIDFCTRCDKCIDACFDELIVKGRGGYPQMDFKRGGCDFCADCLHVCDADALKKIPDTVKRSAHKHHSKSEAFSESAHQSDTESYLPPWHIKASINLNSCLSMNATICRSCGESCDDEAITFNLKLGGVAEPIIDVEACTGCGACFSVCPVQTIKLTAVSVNNSVA